MLTGRQIELHIGYVYGSSKVPANASAYTPKFVPGARLPHAWIAPTPSLTLTLPPATDLDYVSELTHEERSARQYSSLDLCAFDAFTFITSSSTATKAVVEEAAASFRKAHIPVNVVVYGEHFKVSGGETAARSWVDSLGLAESGAVLVRPDQHILTVIGSGVSVDRVVEAMTDHLEGALDR